MPTHLAPAAIHSVEVAVGHSKRRLLPPSDLPCKRREVPVNSAERAPLGKLKAEREGGSQGSTAEPAGTFCCCTETITSAAVAVALDTVTCTRPLLSCASYRGSACRAHASESRWHAESPPKVGAAPNCNNRRPNLHCAARNAMFPARQQQQDAVVSLCTAGATCTGFLDPRRRRPPSELGGNTGSLRREVSHQVTLLGCREGWQKESAWVVLRACPPFVG